MSANRVGGSRQSPRVRRGFSMVESLIAISITAIAGTALLTAMGATIQSTAYAAQLIVAQRIADQLMDEIAATNFPDGVSAAHSLPRVNFTNLDDYAGFSAQPPVDRQGKVYGTEGAMVSGSYVARPTAMQADPGFLKGFKQQVLVERVQPSGTTGWTVGTTHTAYRRITVTITNTDSRVTTTLATRTRIFASVPIGP